MGSAERNTIKKILLAISSLRNIRLFRNNVGLGFIGTIVKEDQKNRVIILKNYRRIKFGLHKGSSDYVGWKTIKIPVEMVGKKIAVFVSLEVKTDKGKPDDEQLNWIDQVIKSGGIAGVVRNVEDALNILRSEDDTISNDSK